MRKTIFFFAISFLFVQIAYSQKQSTRMAGPVCNNRATFLPQPEFPDEVKRQVPGSSVYVRVLIDKEGNVKSAKATTGFEFLHHEAEKAALKAKFEITKLSGTPVEVSCGIIYNFVSTKLNQTNEIKSETENLYQPTISLGVLNDKAKVLPMPKFTNTEAQVRGNTTIQVKVNLQTGEVVSAMAISGNAFLRKYAVDAAMKARFEPVLIEFLTIYATGTLVYNRENFNGKTIENKNAKPLVQTIESGIVNGMAIELPKPEISEEAKNICTNEIVEVAVLIHMGSGKLISAKVISGNQLLSESVRKAALKAKFASPNITGNKDIYVKGELIYKVEPFTECLDVGLVNSKAFSIPNPKLGHIIHPKHLRLQKTININVQIVINPINGEVVKAEVLNGHPLLRNQIHLSAIKTKFTPSFINSEPIFIKGTLIYKVKPNGEVETNISDKIIYGESIILLNAPFPGGVNWKGKESMEVLVETEINEKGYVVSAKSVEGHPLLRSASVLASRYARFTPTYENGKPVQAIAKILYKFLPADGYETEVEVQSIRVKRTVLSGHFLTNLKRIFIAKPDYSKAALAANIKGEVVVKVLVDEFGDVIDAEIVSGHPLLQKESLKAAQLTKFESPKLSNKPINVEGVLTYTFN